MKATAKMILASFAACFALGTCAAEISGVTVRQRWPWSRLVDIDYVITDAAQAVDIEVSAVNGATPLNLPTDSLSGDLYGVSGQGTRRIIWDPTVTAYTNEEVLAKFSVALAPTAVPLYMIVDLTKTNGAADQIQYVYESDLTNGLWGAWVRNPVTNKGEVVESVVWTGVATNDLYKTDKLVLRRIPAGSFKYGDTQTGIPDVFFTKGMYAGVFEVTQKQWNLVMGTTGGTDAQAKHTVSYNDIRGATNSTPALNVNWPTTGRAVAPDSFLGKLRNKTRMADFDLPTKQQWEYFCRAKTTTVFNDGNTNAICTGSVTDNNGKTNSYLNALGWYKYNDPTPPVAAMLVGGKQPNAWGLYDTHGNVWEWCLDWQGVGVARDIRGGAWNYDASDARSAAGRNSSPVSQLNFIGFRLFRALP